VIFADHNQHKETNLDDETPNMNLSDRIAHLGKILPAAVRSVYEGLILKGFTEDQAFALTKTYIFSLTGGRYTS